MSSFFVNSLNLNLQFVGFEDLELVDSSSHLETSLYYHSCFGNLMFYSLRFKNKSIDKLVFW